MCHPIPNFFCDFCTMMAKYSSLIICIVQQDAFHTSYAIFMESSKNISNLEICKFRSSLKLPTNISVAHSIKTKQCTSNFLDFRIKRVNKRLSISFLKAPFNQTICYISTVFDIICREMDCGKLPGSVYLDLSKTLDAIGCNVLMNNDFLLTSNFQRRQCLLIFICLRRTTFGT